MKKIKVQDFMVIISQIESEVFTTKCNKYKNNGIKLYQLCIDYKRYVTPELFEHCVFLLMKRGGRLNLLYKIFGIRNTEYLYLITLIRKFYPLSNCPNVYLTRTLFDLCFEFFVRRKQLDILYQLLLYTVTPNGTGLAIKEQVLIATTYFKDNEYMNIKSLYPNYFV